MSFKRKIGVVSYIVVAVCILLFPHWFWKGLTGDMDWIKSQYSFILWPPEQGAYISWEETAAWEGGIVVLILGTHYVLQMRFRDKQAEQYWRTKWDYAGNNTDTLLRASDRQDDVVHVLLREACPSALTPPEQLLRSSRSSFDLKPEE